MKTLRITALMVLIAAVFGFTGLNNAAIAGDDVVSFNTASVQELMDLDGIEIPEALAKAIVAYREKNGPFKIPTDLSKVPGMTNDFLEELNPVLTEDGSDVVFDPDAEPALAPSKC